MLSAPAGKKAAGRPSVPCLLEETGTRAIPCRTCAGARTLSATTPRGVRPSVEKRPPGRRTSSIGGSPKGIDRKLHVPNAGARRRKRYRRLVARVDGSMGHQQQILVSAGTVSSLWQIIGGDKPPSLAAMPCQLRRAMISPR